MACPVRTRCPSRRAWRNPMRRVWRRLDRSSVRALLGRRRGPDDLAQALTALARALRCQQRLARLAPSFFDAAVVDREAREREEHRRWVASWEPAFEKVYGPSTDAERRARREVHQPRLPGPRTQRAVEYQLVEFDLWMAAGRLALDRHWQRRPHADLSLNQLARLVGIASRLGRQACGFEPRPARPPVPPYGHSFELACAKMFGDMAHDGAA